MVKDAPQGMQASLLNAWFAALRLQDVSHLSSWKLILSPLQLFFLLAGCMRPSSGEEGCRVRHAVIRQA